MMNDTTRYHQVLASHGARYLAFGALLLVARNNLAFSEAENELPEGRSGIASEYPGDKGIDRDPRVIFVERFDRPLSDTFNRWDSVSNREILSISTDVPLGSGDEQSLLMTHTGGENNGAHFYRRLMPGHDLVFARFYVKFDKDCAQIHHFGTHLGGFNPPTRWPQGGAGLLPEGDKRFTTGVEPYGNEWHWGFYTYWQGMRRHGDGKYWGTPFHVGASSPDVEKDRWICVEMMVKANQPVTSSNGEQAFWINGKLWRHEGQVISHLGPGFPKGKWTGGWWRPGANGKSTFEGFNWRSIDSLKVNYLWTYLYITKAPQGHVSKVWFDNIVVSKEYIGPMTPQEK